MPSQRAVPHAFPEQLVGPPQSFADLLDEKYKNKIQYTAMVYPPGWVTLPVGIFALTDRGEVFAGAALTMLLTAATLAVLIGLSRIPAKAAVR